MTTATITRPARLRRLVPAALAAAAIGLTAMTLSAPMAGAQTETEAQAACEKGGGKWQSGQKQPIGGYLGQCCTPNVATGKDDCKSVSYTKLVGPTQGSGPTRPPLPTVPVGPPVAINPGGKPPASATGIHPPAGALQ